MKPLKRAEQHNALLNKDYYTSKEIMTMLSLRDVYIMDGYHVIHYADDVMTEDIRIALDDKKDIKVILDEYGYYTTVCVDEYGRQFYITL